MDGRKVNLITLLLLCATQLTIETKSSVPITTSTYTGKKATDTETTGGDTDKKSIQTLRSNGASTTTSPWNIALLSSYKIPDHFNMDRQVMLQDTKNASYFLLPVSVLSIFINGSLVLLVWKNWEKISDSDYYNSCLLCMLLTLSDLALSLLLALPVAIRFILMEKLGENEAFEYYTEYIGYMLFEYLFIFRMILIAALSVEKCVHIMNPFGYIQIATKTRVKVAFGMIVFVPFAIRIVPAVYFLYIERNNSLSCEYVPDLMEPKKYVPIPLTCTLMIASSLPDWYGIFDAYVAGIIAGLSWLVIVISNVIILTKVFKVLLATHLPQGRQSDAIRGLKGSAVVTMVALSFLLTNFPYSYMWITQLFYYKKPDQEKNYRLQFYLIVLTFLSLLLHPWLYTLRLRSITDLVSGFGNKVRSLFGTSTSQTVRAPTMTSRLRNVEIRS